MAIGGHRGDVTHPMETVFGNCSQCRTIRCSYCVSPSLFPSFPSFRCVPGNAIGPEGARALADALKANGTVQEIYLGGMAFPLHFFVRSVSDALIRRFGVHVPLPSPSCTIFPEYRGGIA